MTQQKIIQWPGGEASGWNYQRLAVNNGFVIFELSKLPNFAEPRFRDLGEQVDDRKAEVARRQLQMLRQLHGLGPNCSVTLRLRRADNQLRLFVLVRKSATHPISTAEVDNLAQSIQQMFPKEYNLQRLLADDNRARWQQAVDLSWANYVDELLKPEPVYEASSVPYFYTAMQWKPLGLNDMESFCRTLMRFNGEAALDVILVPTQLNPAEREWVNMTTLRLREEQNGARIPDRTTGKILKQFEPRPGLRTPVENYEEWLKRYDQTPLFLYAFRVYGATEPTMLTQSFSTSATRSQAQQLRLRRGQPLFDQLLQAGMTVDIAPEWHSPWWDEPDPRPFRAQRLHRLADLDEIAGFWRLPIPIQAGFPGFDLDIGRIGTQQTRALGSKINLGHFTDDPAHLLSETRFDTQGLTKHGLVVGVPGSGKTTTMFNLLHQLWSPVGAQIPFIVLEPAKTEYRALKTMEAFRDDMLVFSLGDERISPFRLNPFEVPRGIPVESHIARLNACFVGAFNLFDPLPLLLDKAIRATYEAKGWFDSSIGGDSGVEAPTLSDLCRQAEAVMQDSGYSEKLRTDFNASLIQRLDSLRRGSKGRMLDTKHSIPFELLMQRPVVLELDALNGDEKALLMMFILTLVYEYAKANRRSGSLLSHVLVIEEAHNLIGRARGSSSENRANPQEHAIRLFIQMLAEMRALGQCILIADQLPTAIAPEAMKQTNLKILMRMTAMDDRTEMGNTMDLEDEHLKAVTRFKSGQAYVYMEEWDRVRQVQTINFKADQQIEEPPGDATLKQMMASFEATSPQLYMPFPECPIGCQQCNREVRNRAERFIRPLVDPKGMRRLEHFVYEDDPGSSTVCKAARIKIISGSMEILQKERELDKEFPFCAYVHLLHSIPLAFEDCRQSCKDCGCIKDGYEPMALDMVSIKQQILAQS